MLKIIEDIEKYEPFNEQEEKDKVEMLFLLNNYENIFSRDNRQFHMTSSAWVVNKGKTKVLMAYHNIFDSWSWLGGHADNEFDLLKVAIKEIKEESGVNTIKVLDKNIFSLEILTVDGHIKRGEYVPSHLHLNVTYLFEADEFEPLKVKEDENRGVKWFTFEDAMKASNEKWFKQNVYSKLNDKLIKYYKK